MANRHVPAEGESGPNRSSIASFAVAPDTGRMALLGISPCGDHPRFFAVDPSRRWMLVNAMGDCDVNILRLGDDGAPMSAGGAGGESGGVSGFRHASWHCGFPASHVLFCDPSRLAMVSKPAM